MIEEIELTIRDGIRVGALAAGPEDGPLVLCAHGFPQTPDSWRQILPALAAAGHRAVAPVQRGYAPGNRPTSLAGYRLPEMAADATGAADALGADRFDIVGHDWGGVVAWWLAANLPSRLRTATSLSTPHPAAFARAMRSPVQLARAGYMAGFAVPGVAERVLSAGGGAVLRRVLEVSGLGEEHAARYAAALDQGALAGGLRWYRGSRPSDLALGPSRVPTLFVWGARDPVLGREAAEATESHVDAPYRFVELPHAGHWLGEHHADDVIPPLLDHLAAHASDGGEEPASAR